MKPVASQKDTTPADENHPHYEWGASAAKQWRGCPGSVAFTRIKRVEGVIPEDTSTKYSREGTEAHNWVDKVLKGEAKREDIPPSFREHLDGYIDLAQELAAENGGTVYHEQKVALFYNPLEVGTLDYAVVSEDRVDILDLKYGAGVYVTAADNDQLAIYAVSLMAALKGSFTFTNDTIVRMHIYQPRHHEFDGLPEVWETSYRDLLDHCIDVEEDYKRSKLASAEDLRPSKDACQFCDARRVCHKRVAVLFDGLPDELNPIIGEPKPKEATGAITDAVRVHILKYGKEIAKFFEDTNEDTTLMIEQGKQIEGLKTVDGGKGNRKWGDNEDDADNLLRKLPASERYQPKKLISPAQAEKVLKKLGMPLEKQSTRFQNRFNELIVQKEGKPMLALASDPRPARVVASDRFDDETETPAVSEDDCF